MMKKPDYLKCFLLISAITLSCGVCRGAEVRFIDPQIPDGEKITYNVRIGEETEVMVEETAVKTEDSREIYEVMSVSKFEDKVVKIDRKTMSVTYSDITQKSAEVSIDRKTTVLKMEAKPAGNEVLLTDFNGLNFLMRGFPLKEKRPVRIRPVGGRNQGPFILNVKLAGETSLKIGDKTLPCYELELGMSGIFGALFSKVRFWYSMEMPHYLVKYEGNMGPGTPKQVWELKEYTVIKK
jgi:hypothetical protein